MTGVSLRYRGMEHLSLPGGLDALRAGHTTGLPLLAPWANRLASRRYRAGGVAVDLHRQRLHTDENGLPIHGLLLGKPGWRIDRQSTRGESARFAASIDVVSRAFPFRHRIELGVTARDAQLLVDTTIIPTSRRRVPIAFGWHPYLRLPGTRRRDWQLRLPSRRHVHLDARGIPTGVETLVSAGQSPIGQRTFDDLYALGRDRRLSFEGDDGAGFELHCGAGYPFAQVWAPPGRTFAALEPMTARTNALGEGTAALVAPGSVFTARFTLTIT